MARFRLPDWTIYAAVVIGIGWAAASRREVADAPTAPPPVAAAPAPAAPDGPLLGPATAFDPAILVEAGSRPQTGFGTAFSVDRGGRWLTARHVVEGCTRLVVVTDPGRGVGAQGWVDPNADIAVLTTAGGAAAMPLGLARPLRLGERAFHIGFPQGSPGEATSRLIGRETLAVLGRGARREPVLAWAETGRTDGLKGSLGGLSGGPAVDALGQVVGVTIAENPRRGRIYTTAPETLAEATRSQVGPTQTGVAQVEPPSTESYGRVGDRLRRDLRVAPVVCLSVS